MKNIISVVMLLGIVTSGFANFNDAVNAYKGVEHKQLATASTQVAAIGQMSAQTVHDNMALVNHFLHAGQQSLQHYGPHHGGRAANGAILFVSFSMPSPLLRQMGQQAHAFHIPVILRGLVGNSMPKTLQAFLTLKQVAKHHHQVIDGIGIDPVWFRQFGIERVPALVVTKRPRGCIAEKECAGQPFDVVYGNQSIEDSLQQMTREGSAIIRPIAAQMLQTRRVN